MFGSVAAELVAFCPLVINRVSSLPSAEPFFAVRPRRFL